MDTKQDTKEELKLSVHEQKLLHFSEKKSHEKATVIMLFIRRCALIFSYKKLG